MQLEKRSIGNTGLKITTLGLGGASLAGNVEAATDETARELIAHSLGLGIDYVDTAPFYGFGKSEHVIGDGIRDLRENLTLSTKVGRLLAPQTGPYARPHGWKNPYPFVDVFDYSYDGIMRSYEDSLQRLGTNRIDILYVHDVDPTTHKNTGGNAEHWKALETGGYRALTELKSSGAVKAIGLGVNEWPILMQALELGDWDVFLLAGRYTLLEQASLSPFMDACVKRNTSVVIGGPFNSGILVGGTTWDYVQAPKEVLDAVAKIEAVCTRFNVELPAAALQFPLAHPVVCSVIPGPRTVKEMDQIAQWWEADIPADFWIELRKSGCIVENAPLPGGV